MVGQHRKESLYWSKYDGAVLKIATTLFYSIVLHVDDCSTLSLVSHPTTDHTLNKRVFQVFSYAGMIVTLS